MLFDKLLFFIYFYLSRRLPVFSLSFDGDWLISQREENEFNLF